MMLTGATASPFATIESLVQNTLFCGSSPYAALPAEENKSCNGNGTGSAAKNGAAGNRPPTEGCRALPENREDSEITSCKKTD